MTFNSAQQERLLAALERIADALEAQARPTRIIQTDSPLSPADVQRIRDELGSTNSTKGPYR